jgi:hypothetical protein
MSNTSRYAPTSRKVSLGSPRGLVVSLSAGRGVPRLVMWRIWPLGNADFCRSSGRPKGLAASRIRSERALSKVFTPEKLANANA